MMKPMYYNDYYKRYNVQYERGKYNIVRTPCGSGKTFHCLDVITSDYNEEHRRGGKCECYRCLYVTDTTALRESVIDSYLQHTGKTKMNPHNLEVHTYAKLGRMIEELGVDGLCNKYDYIFLDEIHQLFVYEEKFDSEDDSYYGLVMESLEDIVREDVTLICLSATPEKLLDYIRKVIAYGEHNRIKDIVPVSELHKIKSYVNRYDIPVFDATQAINEINLEADDKLFIFAHTIRELQDLEEQCLKRGWTTCSLWSINQNKEYNYCTKQLAKDDLTDEDIREYTERLTKAKPMSDYQLEAREQLITTGEYNTQVLLLNGAYESGINIENGVDSEQHTIHVVVASTEEHTIVQARGRIRHDIDCLWHLSSDTYDCITSSSGVDNNKNLAKRLEQLAEECEADKYTFVGNDGRTKISNILQLYTIYEKKGKQYRKQCKSVDAMNNVLLLRELPFKIEQRKERKRVNGKVKELSIYIVIDKRKEN